MIFELVITIIFVLCIFLVVIVTKKWLNELDEERKEDAEFDEWWLEHSEFHPRGRSFEEFYWSRQDAREQWKNQR